MARNSHVVAAFIQRAKKLTWVLVQDLITGDEIISDSYDLKEVDGVVYEVDCSMITLGAVEVSKLCARLYSSGSF